MINKDKIELNVAAYYTPSYTGARAVSILKLVGEDSVKVKPYSFKGDAKPFVIPIAHVYNCAADAERGQRGWKHYMKHKGNRTPLKGVNDKGMEQIHIEDIRMLVSYGLTPIPNAETHRYAIKDRKGKFYAGEDFSLGADEIAAIVARLRADQPLYLPSFAEGLYYPSFYEKCLEVYREAKTRGESLKSGNLWHLFRAKFGTNEGRAEYFEYKKFVGGGLCYKRNPSSLKAIGMSIFTNIRSRDVSGLLDQN